MNYYSRYLLDIKMNDFEAAILAAKKVIELAAPDSDNYQIAESFLQETQISENDNQIEYGFIASFIIAFLSGVVTIISIS